jgi:TolA-binding protein
LTVEERLEQTVNRLEELEETVHRLQEQINSGSAQPENHILQLKARLKVPFEDIADVNRMAEDASLARDFATYVKDVVKADAEVVRHYVDAVIHPNLFQRCFVNPHG